MSSTTAASISSQSAVASTPPPLSTVTPSRSSQPKETAGAAAPDTGAPLPRRRRSARVLEHDPIVAPGFGTTKDVARLAAQLGVDPDRVGEIMRARGRGAAPEAATDAAADASAGVWADFLGEEGFSQAAPAASSSSSAAAGKRDYQLASKDNIKSPSGKAKKAKPAAGVLLQAGTLDSSIVGRTKSKLTEAYDCTIPSQILARTRVAAVFTGCNSCHSIALAETGAIYGWGRNEAHQLGANLPPHVVLPTILDLPDASDTGGGLRVAATGKAHSLLLMRDGSVYALGANKVGQCGVRTTGDAVPRPRRCLLVDEAGAALAAPADVRVTSVACGEDFSVLLDADGHVYSTGSSEFGQLGNGETGEYFITANKLAFANCNVFTRRTDHYYHFPEPTAGGAAAGQPLPSLELLPDAGHIRIQAIACGKHHTIALEAESADGTSRPRAFTWGCGNYGCLGHGRQVDEYYPRQMQYLPLTCDLRGARVAAGAQCNLILTANGHVYYNGKHRSVGEATMKPVLVEQLAANAHHITACASGFQTVVCCSDIGNTVAWGQGPYGELALHDQKSSAKPAFVDHLSGIPMMQVACGYGHTLFLAKDEDKAAKDALKKLPVLAEDDVEALLAK